MAAGDFPDSACSLYEFHLAAIALPNRSHLVGILPSYEVQYQASAGIRELGGESPLGQNECGNVGGRENHET